MCWHKWSKWIDKASGRVLNPLGLSFIPDNLRKIGEPNGDAWIEQERRCEKCGKVQLRTEIA